MATYALTNVTSCKALNFKMHGGGWKRNALQSTLCERAEVKTSAGCWCHMTSVGSLGERMDQMATWCQEPRAQHMWNLKIKAGGCEIFALFCSAQVVSLLKFREVFLRSEKQHSVHVRSQGREHTHVPHSTPYCRWKQVKDSSHLLCSSGYLLLKMLTYSNCDVLLNISDLTCGVTPITLKSDISRYSLSWFVRF